jgi:hypothetical protein
MIGYPGNQHLLFKSFTGLSVKQFDDIYKVIESKYPKHEIKRLSHNKRNREKELLVL